MLLVIMASMWTSLAWSTTSEGTMMKILSVNHPVKELENDKTAENKTTISESFSANKLETLQLPSKSTLPYPPPQNPENSQLQDKVATEPKPMTLGQAWTNTNLSQKLPADPLPSEQVFASRPAQPGQNRQQDTRDRQTNPYQAEHMKHKLLNSLKQKRPFRVESHSF